MRGQCTVGGSGGVQCVQSSGRELAGTEDRRGHDGELSMGKCGISVKKREPRSAQWSRITERRRRTHQRDTRMLHDSGLPKFLWAEVYNTVTYVHNGTPTRALGELTPYEACYGAKPGLAHLRAFGAPCAIFEPQARLKKLDDWASTVEAEIGFGTWKGAEPTSPGDDADIPIVQQLPEHAVEPARSEVAAARIATPIPTHPTISRRRPNDLFMTCHMSRTTSARILQSGLRRSMQGGGSSGLGRDGGGAIAPCS